MIGKNNAGGGELEHAPGGVWMTVLSSNPAGRPAGFERLRAERQAHIRLAALLVTLVLHGLLFWWGMNSARFSAPSQEKLQAIRVFLQPLELPELAAPARPPCAKPGPAARPAAAPPLVPLPREASPPASPVAAAPVAVAAPESAPSPIAATSLAPLPVAAAAAAPAAPVADAGRAARETASLAPAAKASAGGGPVGVAPGTEVAGASGSAAGTGKELYLRALFAHIEAHKFYPASARRRQLEGQVRVAFTIDAAGGVSDLTVSEGHPQLAEAARQTVLGARPLPLPAAGVKLPFSLTYNMDFRLR